MKSLTMLSASDKRATVKDTRKIVELVRHTTSGKTENLPCNDSDEIAVLADKYEMPVGAKNSG